MGKKMEYLICLGYCKNSMNLVEYKHTDSFLSVSDKDTPSESNTAFLTIACHGKWVETVSVAFFCKDTNATYQGQFLMA